MMRSQPAALGIHPEVRENYRRILRERNLPPLLPAWQYDHPGYLYPPVRLVEMISMAVDAYLLIDSSAAKPGEAGALIDMVSQLRLYEGRVFGVTREMATALWETDPPEIPIGEIPMPLDTVILTFPARTIPWVQRLDAKCDGCDAGQDHNAHQQFLAYAVLSRIDTAEYEERRQRAIDFILDVRGFTVGMEVINRGPRHFYRTLIVSDQGWMNRLQGDCSYSLQHPMSEENTLSNHPITAEDQRMVGFLWNVVAVMHARPELVSSGRRVEIQRGAKASRRTVIVQQVPLIGAGYRPERHDLGGTHASPHAHWRRGHFRNQVHGPKRALRKLRWIEPIFVAGG